MTVLVTGCAGFIGFQVCRVLLEDGQRVEGLDDLNDAYDIRLKEWRLSELKPYSKFRFRKLDISNYSALRSVFASNEEEDSPPFDSIVNLGARAGGRGVRGQRRASTRGRRQRPHNHGSGGGYERELSCGRPVSGRVKP